MTQLHLVMCKQSMEMHRRFIILIPDRDFISFALIFGDLDF